MLCSPTPMKPHAEANPDWILLDTVTRGSSYRWKSLTSATAWASTAKALVTFRNNWGVELEAEVEVSFRLLEPPNVSSFAVRCRGPQGGDDLANDSHVVSAEGDVVLLHITLLSHRPGLYFVYRACHGNPSLEALPRPSGCFNRINLVGILPRGSGGYVVAAAIRVTHLDGVLKYVLSLYSSKTKAWSTKLVPLDCDSDWSDVWNHRTNKVIAVGGDSLGWVDLWWGVLVCNLLDEEDPTLRFIQLPGPMPGNEDLFVTSSARSSRDTVCVGDVMKFVEILHYGDDHGRTDHGWKATAWSRMLSSNDWHHCCTVDTDDIPVTDKVHSYLLPELGGDEAKRLSFNDFIWYGPTLSMDDHVLYMTLKLSRNPRDLREWQAAVNMNKNTLQLVSFTAEETYFCDPTYRPIALFKNQSNGASCCQGQSQ